MRWSKVASTRDPVPSSRWKVLHWVLSTGCWVLLALIALLSAPPSALSNADDRRISVYSPVAIYSLPVLERAGHEYIGLLELLEPLGRVSSQSEGQHWKLRYNTVDAAFAAGRTRAVIRGHDFDLPAPFLIENSRGLVPISSLGTLLPRFLGTSVNFHESARRLFVGDVAIQPSFRLDASNPPHLLLTFTAPVNPTISTEPGKLRMVFKRDPVVSPGSQSISFDNNVIKQASYSENNGDAELEVAANQPLMASFNNDRRTIIISAVQQTSATPSVAGSPNRSSSNAGSPNNGSPNLASPNLGSPNAESPNAESPNNGPLNNGAENPAPAQPAASVAQRVLAVVDPAHGGEERGAALSDSLAEKDVTLGFARLLRHELQIRGFAVAMLRDGDSTLTLDQRAAAANVARAGIYISLHAGSQGNRSGVYTALLPREGSSKGVFRAWNAAQAPVLLVSGAMAAAVVTEFQKKNFAARASSASLRPLNNVLMPAIAVELAPGSNGMADLTSATYQQQAAAAIADAVVSVRDRLGVQQ